MTGKKDERRLAGIARLVRTGLIPALAIAWAVCAKAFMNEPGEELLLATTVLATATGLRWSAVLARRWQPRFIAGMIIVGSAVAVGAALHAVDPIVAIASAGGWAGGAIVSAMAIAGLSRGRDALFEPFGGALLPRRASPAGVSRVTRPAPCGR